MRRHPTDLVGLIFGTAFAIAGVGFIVNAVTDNTVNPAWATGLGLMLLGAVAFVATVARSIRHPDDDRLHSAEFQHAYAQYGFVAPEPVTEPVTETVETTVDPEAPAGPLTPSDE